MSLWRLNSGTCPLNYYMSSYEIKIPDSYSIAIFSDNSMAITDAESQEPCEDRVKHALLPLNLTQRTRLINGQPLYLKYHLCEQVLLHWQRHAQPVCFVCKENICDSHIHPSNKEGYCMECATFIFENTDQIVLPAEL